MTNLDNSNTEMDETDSSDRRHQKTIRYLERTGIGTELARHSRRQETGFR